MKHIAAGQKVRLRMEAKGEVYFIVDVLNEENGKSKKIDFLLDTGFNGYLQLNKSDADELDLKLKDKTFSTGYDGITKEIAITTTKILFLDQEISNFPIQIVPNGASLIGTMLLRDTKRMIILDFTHGEEYETITFDKQIKDEVKSTIHKLAS